MLDPQPQDVASASQVTPPHIIHTFEHRAYPLTGERPFSIGRSTECDVVVNEVAVSRRHAEVRTEGEEYVLQATGSMPVFMDEVLLTAPRPLQEGDAFTIGTMRFVFTRGRLPAGMSIATRHRGSSSSIDDRRPTITFNKPVAEEPSGTNGKKMVWGIVIALLVAVVAYAASV